MAMLCHLLALFTSFIGPLIVWLVKREQSPYVDAHGRAVLNFIISVYIYYAGLFVLLFISIPLTAVYGLGLLLMCPSYLAMISLSIFQLVVTIVHCIQAYQGTLTPYPLTMTFLKGP